MKTTISPLAVRARSYLLLLALGTGSVLATNPAAAAPGNDPKRWHYNLPAPGHTVNELEPNDNCLFGAQPLLCGTLVDRAWLENAADIDNYAVTLYAGDILTVATNNDSDPNGHGGRATDTVLEIVAGDCQTVLASDDDSGPDRLSFIPRFVAPSDGIYFLRVTGYAGERGDYKLLAFCGRPVPGPAADRCSQTLLLPPCSEASVEGSMTSARNDYDPGLIAEVPYGAAGRDLAYGISLVAGDQLVVSYTATEDGVVYLLADCADPSASCVAGADASSGGHAVETLDYTATSSGTYYLVLDSYGTETGTTWSLSYTITCAPPAGACCLPDGQCEIRSEADCAGTYLGDRTTCDPNPCGGDPAFGACCLYDAICVRLTAADCAALSGNYRGDDTDCTEGSCLAPVPTRRVTWGGIKNRYQ